jgi:eukaryotic-like serine/threonine-protein kinase
MALASGVRLGPYEILSALGAGGMGEVYRARDTRLNRDVALKILPELFAADHDRLARFQREAQLLASLNHPHIAAIHGFEETATVKALVLELVDGPTLADRIAQGPLPLDEVLSIARQIAEALEAAHEKGVIHRDLKPANIKVTPDGAVKVLDFGLAKILDDGSGTPADRQRAALSLSPTLSVHATYAGVILGTAAYMSPEQARGRSVDKRADVWAFGCVLFEMIAGARAFDGEDIAETIGAVIHKDPAWDRLPPATPATVRTVVRRCLEKDPKQRVRDIGDVQLALSGAFDTPPQAASAVPAASRSRGRFAMVAAAALAVAALSAAAAWIATRATPVKPRPVRFTITPPPTQPFNVQGFFRNLAISDDGANLVYVAGGDAQLMVRAIDQLEPIALRGITNAGFPFFSPDGKWIGFFTGASGELRKVSITGGPPITLCRYQGTPRGATWGADGTIIFATNDVATGLLSVPAAGGDPKVLTKPDGAHGELDHVMPALLPDGHAVLFTITSAGGNDTAQIAALDLKSGRIGTLVRGGTDGQYVDTGHLVYASGGSLRAMRFDAARLEVLGDPVPVVDQVVTLQTGAADFRVARQGTLVYVAGGSTGGTVTRSLAWVTRDGREEAINAPTRGYTIVRLSPDETQVAVDIREPQGGNIWIWNFSRQTLTPLTFGSSTDTIPIWTPNGRRIVFSSGRAGPPNLFWQASDGTGTAERLTTSVYIQAPTAFSPDGKTLVVQESRPKTGPDLMLLRMDGARQTEPLIQSEGSDLAGEVSPDGRWLAYYSSESGRSEVYVRPFPNVNDGRWQISNAGGTRPAWSKDGRELFYVFTRANLLSVMAVAVQTTSTFSAGNPTRLFDGPWYAVQAGRTFDVSRDGKRFLMIKEPTLGGGDRSASPTITVVVNWTEELAARIPSK